MRGEKLLRSGWISPLEQTRGAGLHRRDAGKARRDRQVHQPVVQLGDGRRIVPAQAEDQAELGRDPPVVVDEKIVAGAAEIFVGVAVADRGGGRNAQQEIGQVVARTALCHAVHQQAGGRAVEGVRPAAVGIGELVELLAPVVAAEREVVPAVHPHQAVAHRAGLVAVERCVAVAEPGVVGEAQVGRPPVHGVLRGARDAEPPPRSRGRQSRARTAGASG